MIDRLMLADVVCIGETHDSEAHHRVQLQIVKAALCSRRAALGVGMEMFQRPFQKEIDRYFRGESKEDEFLKATEYKSRAGVMTGRCIAPSSSSAARMKCRWPR